MSSWREGREEGRKGGGGGREGGRCIPYKSNLHVLNTLPKSKQSPVVHYPVHCNEPSLL